MVQQFDSFLSGVRRGVAGSTKRLCGASTRGTTINTPYEIPARYTLYYLPAYILLACTKFNYCITLIELWRLMLGIG